LITQPSEAAVKESRRFGTGREVGARNERLPWVAFHRGPTLKELNPKKRGTHFSFPNGERSSGTVTGLCGILYNALSSASR
jgi:hypothetical protein